MDKVNAEAIKRELIRLTELAEEREYKSRIMSLEIKADSSGENDWTVVGKLTLKASEHPGDENSWKVVPIEVMIHGSTAEVAVGDVLKHLNAIPVEWGDSIFEDNFFDLIQGKLPSSEKELVL